MEGDEARPGDGGPGRVGDDADGEGLRRSLLALPFLVVGLGEAGLFAAWNPACEAALGYPAESMVGRPEAPDRLRSVPDQVAERILAPHGDGPEEPGQEWPVAAADGTVRVIRWWDMTATLPVPGWGVWGVGIDVTEGHQLADELRQSRERYRDIFESAPYAVYHSSVRGQILRANTAAAELFGYDAPAALVEGANSVGGARAALYVSPSDRDAIISAVVATDGWVTRTVGMVTRSGQIVPIRLRARAARDSAGAVQYIETHAESTEPRQAWEREMAFRASLLDHISDSITATDLSGRVTYVNAACCALLGRAKHELVGRPVEAYGEDAGRGATQREIVERTLADGQWRGEVVNYTRDGTPRVLDCRTRLLWDDEGNPVGMCGISADVTDRQEAEAEVRRLNAELEARVAQRTRELEESMAELTRTQWRLAESEKLSALGGLVAGMAHEINTPIGIGVTAASHLGMQTTEARRLLEAGALSLEELQEYFEAATEASRLLLANMRRAAELVRSFKQVAVDQASEQRRTFDLAEYLADVMLSLRPRYRHSAHTVTVECPAGIEMHSYPGALSQVVANLLINALTHAFDEGEAGEVRIAAAADGDQVVLSVIDSGRGVSAQDKPHLFEPFFTTRRGRGGTGLGLHIAHNLVTGPLGGHIECQTTEGEGTAFVVAVPSVAPEPEGGVDLRL
jgi:PAS domain S-box-containing protein